MQLARYKLYTTLQIYAIRTGRASDGAAKRKWAITFTIKNRQQSSAVLSVFGVLSQQQRNADKSHVDTCKFRRDLHPGAPVATTACSITQIRVKNEPSRLSYWHGGGEWVHETILLIYGAIQTVFVMLNCHMQLCRWATNDRDRIKLQGRLRQFLRLPNSIKVIKCQVWSIGGITINASINKMYRCFCD